MLHIRMAKKAFWFLIALLTLSAMWVLQIELTYERNVRRGIPADFRIHPEHTVVMWKAQLGGPTFAGRDNS